MICPKIHGWHIFNDFEVCADDALMNDHARGFLGDYEALQHIPTCPDCAAKLGRAVARDMIDCDSYGWWTVDPAVHYAGHVTPALLVSAGEWGEEDE